MFWNQILVSLYLPYYYHIYHSYGWYWKLCLLIKQFFCGHCRNSQVTPQKYSGYCRCSIHQWVMTRKVIHTPVPTSCLLQPMTEWSMLGKYIWDCTIVWRMATVLYSRNGNCPWFSKFPWFWTRLQGNKKLFAEKKIGGTKNKGTSFTSAENTREQSECIHAWLPPVSLANWT